MYITTHRHILTHDKQKRETGPTWRSCFQIPKKIQVYQEVSVHLTIAVHAIYDLKMAITEFIRNLDRAIRNTVFQNAVRRVNKCLETGGEHFEHYL